MRMISFFFITLLMVIISCNEKKESKISDAKEIHRCANCGMITSKYPKWEQKVVSSDKGTMYFDGARCMFKILLDEKQHPQKIDSIMVKDYYSLEYIDGNKAYYVIGSDVLGPMGNELISFQSLKDAEEFKKDHKGEKIIGFADVDMKLVMKLAGKMKMK